MSKNLDQQINQAEQQAGTSEDINEDSEKKEKLDPIRVESLMATGNFESPKKAEECLMQLDEAFRQQKRSDKIVKEFTDNFEQIIKEAEIQMESIEGLSDGELIDRKEVFQGILKGIAENFEDLQEELKGIEGEKGFSLVEIPQKMGHYVGNHKLALITVGLTRLLLGMGNSEAEAGETSGDILEVPDDVLAHENISNINNIENENTEQEVEKKSVDSETESIEKTPAQESIENIKQESDKDAKEKILEKVSAIYKWKLGPFEGSQADEWGDMKEKFATNILAGEFGEHTGLVLDIAEMNNREQLQNYIQEADELIGDPEKNETVEQYLTRFEKVIDIDKIGDILSNIVENNDSIKDGEGEWDKKMSRVANIDIRGFAESESMKDVKILENVFVTAITEKGLEGIDSGFEIFIKDKFEQINQGKDEKEKVNYILYVREERHGQITVEIWDEYGAASVGCYYEGQDDGGNLEDALKSAVDGLMPPEYYNPNRSPEEDKKLWEKLGKDRDKFKNENSHINDSGFFD